jgi:hypothetical protein
LWEQEGLAWYSPLALEYGHAVTIMQHITPVLQKALRIGMSQDCYTKRPFPEIREYHREVLRAGGKGYSPLAGVRTDQNKEALFLRASRLGAKDNVPLAGVRTSRIKSVKPSI